MNTEVLRRRLMTANISDMNVHSPLSSDNGFKISIQGKCVEDSIFLYERLSEFLMSNDVPFKVATKRRFEIRNNSSESRHHEQSYKAMTIYCPDGFSFDELCESVYNLIIDYKGWYNIKTPTSYTHYAGGLFTRNDRDTNGVYVRAN